MTEARYTSLTFDLTLSVARTLVSLNPGMTFIFVSGAGADSSEHGRIMWARVKRKAENALLRLPFKPAYMFRPRRDAARRQKRLFKAGARGKDINTF